LYSILGAISFACFSVFWSTLAFHLASPALGYGSAVAGGFGLIGVVGAVAAPLVGRFADGRDPAIITVIACSAVFASFVVFGLFGESLIGLAIGVVLLDLGVQSNQITNQARVYALAPAMRNRLNTIYMASYFAGGALGSAIGVFAWSSAGWRAVSIAGGALALIALALFAALRRSVH
jgi:predicted MFS family arabinose efflux permease